MPRKRSLNPRSERRARKCATPAFPIVVLPEISMAPAPVPEHASAPAPLVAPAPTPVAVAASHSVEQNLEWYSWAEEVFVREHVFEIDQILTSMPSKIRPAFLLEWTSPEGSPNEQLARALRLLPEIADSKSLVQYAALLADQLVRMDKARELISNQYFAARMNSVGRHLQERHTGESAALKTAELMMQKEKDGVMEMWEEARDALIGKLPICCGQCSVEIPLCECVFICSKCRLVASLLLAARAWCCFSAA